MQRWISAMVLGIGVLLAAWLAWRSYDQALAYERANAALVQEAELGQQVSRLGKRWLSGLSLGTYDPYAEDLEALEELRARAEQLRHAARGYFFGFLAAAVTVGLLAWVADRRRATLIMATLLMSLVALAPGLAAPAMAMTAAQEVPALGPVTLYYESRGVLSTIRELLGHHGSVLIGIPILVFSVFIPTLKTLVMMAAVLSRGAFGRRLMGLIHRIGKWSMADVCVVGWLLGFLATEHQALMTVELQVGIFFFACYAILSIAAAQLLDARWRVPGAAEA